MTRGRFLTVVLLISLRANVNAHVGLTFPPARKLDLDFLDSVRTKKPCGMPKGLLRTNLMAGSEINVTWHLAYPHQGGFRLELLDKDERLMTTLSETDSQNSFVTGNPTAQWYAVKVPEEACEDCTIRLLREAKEWTNYHFWSCADIRIVKPKDYKEDCFGRGNANADSNLNQKCTCEKRYWGPRCQFEDECDIDSDCGNGKCIDLGGTALPRKQCFCAFGYHGNQCRMRNKDTLSTSENLELSTHKKSVLSDRMMLYHKIISAESVPEAEKEMEFVLIINGTSYGAVGWKPATINKTCKSMPALEDQVAVTRKTRAARSRPQKSNPTLLEPLHMHERIRAEPESSSKRVSKNKNSSKSMTVQPEPENTDSTPEPEAEAESEPSPEAVAEPEHGTGASRNKPGVKDKSKLEAEGISEPEAESEPKSEAESEPESGAASITEPEATSEPKPESEPEGSSESTKVTKNSPKSKGQPCPATVKEGKAEPEPEIVAEPEPSSEPSAEPDLASKKSSSILESSNLQMIGEPDAAADESASATVFAEAEPSIKKVALENRSPFKLEARKTSYTPKDGLHAMDCSDIILGQVRGKFSRIFDGYTRDRSTPRDDLFWGGTDDITSAAGWEQNGVTTLIFRRKIQTSDPTDHSLKGAMTVIWARGQQHGEYVHNPKSGLEKENPSIPNFYAEDEIKYHGQSKQRGVLFIDFSE